MNNPASAPAKTPLPPLPSPSPLPPLRLAMLGMIDGNGHPFSWSSIINSFDPAVMAKCPYAGIQAYLGCFDPATVGVPGARVTHVWTDRPEEAPLVAATALIPNILARPEDAIGQVDAVIIATDDGLDHVRRARPFVEAGLPVFVDKPLAVSLEELSTFVKWQRAGARILSSSGLRYMTELDPLLANRHIIGKWRWISGVVCKTWERYGIHALEPIHRLLGPGLESVRLETKPGLEIAHIHHKSGVQITIPVIADGGATFGTFDFYGAGGKYSFRIMDTYTAFRRQMVEYVDYLRGGCVAASYPFTETIEICAALVAGVRSRAEGSRRVDISEILESLPR